MNLARSLARIHRKYRLATATRLSSHGLAVPPMCLFSTICFGIEFVVLLICVCRFYNRFRCRMRRVEMSSCSSVWCFFRVLLGIDSNEKLLFSFLSSIELFLVIHSLHSIACCFHYTLEFILTKPIEIMHFFGFGFGFCFKIRIYTIKEWKRWTKKNGNKRNE